MKDKKKLSGAATAIISTLRKGYDLLNAEGQLPQVDDATLPNLALAIVSQLQKEITLIEDQAQYDGMTPEEVANQKERDRHEALAKLQEESAAQLAKMKERPAPESVEADADQDGTPVDGES
jgi:hypothetical protein